MHTQKTNTSRCATRLFIRWRIPYMLQALLVVSALLCEPFPTRYDRIEDNAVRSTGFTYYPYAEGAPGDTIRIRAFFPGKPVTSVSWQMSYSRVFNVYASRDTVLDVFDIDAIAVSDRLPDSVDITFAIPESTFFYTKAILQQALDLCKSRLPAGMRNMTQQDLAGLLLDFGNTDLGDAAALAAFLDRWSATLDVTMDDPALMETLTEVGTALLYTFSVSGVVYANATAGDGSRLRVKGEFTIRYNRRFQNTVLAPLVPVNRNPALRWVGMYTVQGSNVYSFSPSDRDFDGKVTFSYLYNELFPDSAVDTVVIDTGYSYFLAADSGIMSYTLHRGDSVQINDTTWLVLDHDTTIIDTALDRITFTNSSGRDTFELETVYFDWQYQNLALDSVTEPLDSLLFLFPGSTNGGGGQSSIVKMLPSLDPRMNRARIWVTAYDYLLGEYNRPSAFATRNVEIGFSYTAAYKNARQ
ncbi:MAG: hypothetical protein JW768_00465 [Chitinispirillaceae bacterium]|nr:hypothetical protein [Chitinispirillaceae bacterium]